MLKMAEGDSRGINGKDIRKNVDMMLVFLHSLVAQVSDSGRDSS